jgi:hypothetical protein
MAVRESIELAALGELLDRIGSACFEQSVARGVAFELGRNQRFRNQIEKAFDDFGSRNLGAASDRTGRLQAEGASEHT